MKPSKPSVKKYILLAVAVVSMAACGGSSDSSADSSNSPSTAVTRTKNAALPTNLVCATGGKCAIGDTGPAGGVVFAIDTNAGADQQYLEIACSGWKNRCDGGVDPKMNWDTALSTAKSYSTTGATTGWRLPLIPEINELCKYARGTGQAAGQNIECSGGTLKAGFSDFYWSAEIKNATLGYGRTLGDGKIYTFPRSSETFVRPMRKFGPLCAYGGRCSVGDKGPGGGTIFYGFYDNGLWSYGEVVCDGWNNKCSGASDPEKTFAAAKESAQGFIDTVLTTGWHLPYSWELMALCQYARGTGQEPCSGGTLRSGYGSGRYWTQDVAFDRVTYINFSDGKLSKYDISPGANHGNTRMFVRPVRNFTTK